MRHCHVTFGSHMHAQGHVLAQTALPCGNFNSVCHTPLIGITPYGPPGIAGGMAPSHA